MYTSDSSSRQRSSYVSKPALVLFACALIFGAVSSLANAAVVSRKPGNLKCDALSTPMGLDTPQPQLSWQLEDDRDAAKQTAYELQVATQPALLVAGRPDVWDSGRVASDKSVGVAYAGPELKPEQRYYWRVKVWDKDGIAYPTSDVTWWETGLLKAAEWRGKWIGFEEQEERRIRESDAVWITNQGGVSSSGAETRHDFRRAFTLSGPIKHAHLYVTGKDTASAWVNGKQVLAGEPSPPWKQTPWKSYK
jgi:alpha-L-rhamnosidase